MALTAANITDYIRSLLNEDTAAFWTDADIVLYEQVGMNIVQNNFHPFMKNKNKTFELVNMTDGTNEITPNVNSFRITGVEIAETGARLRYITDNEYWKYAEWDDGEPTTWMWKAGKIMLIPTPSATETEFFRIWYLPIMDAVTEFPECLRPLIAIEAVINAKTRDENVTQDLLMLHKRYSDAAMIALAMDQMQEPTIWGDFELEEGYA